ncbi:MAG TPA: hypothetical protein VLC08_14775 [Chitinolyticbacter sp.]|nr:hypothetical protein [Chitinolyticbacter sp.]
MDEEWLASVPADREDGQYSLVRDGALVAVIGVVWLDHARSEPSSPTWLSGPM